VTRISPEAPVPVVNVGKRTFCLVGAANVMRNIATLGGKALAFGAVGDDASGKEIIAGLDEFNIAHDGIVTAAGRRTTEKCRVVAGAQQLLRADFEDTLPLNDDLREIMVGKIEQLIADGKLDAVIFDDYAKGVLDAWMLQRIIAAARQAHVVTLLDPKPKAGGVTPVKGLTVLKPNRGEAFALSGVHDDNFAGDPAENQALLTAAAKIFEIWEPEYLLISLAAQGMALFHNGELLKHIPTRAQEVFDVSGAGDTVAASCTLALATGNDAVLAAEIANFAAGVVVGKIGTAPIMRDELLAAVK
jgi:D-beta-D-heptose 7-phosphate kinase/D-beta-D-heptose 1-phosphate adenosyltransferase